MEYSRFVARDAVETGLDATIKHVTEHLSSVADADDDPETFAADVVIHLIAEDDGILVRGSLDAEPNAFYLAPGYVPVDDGEFKWED